MVVLGGGAVSHERGTPVRVRVNFTRNVNLLFSAAGDGPEQTAVRGFQPEATRLPQVCLSNCEAVPKRARM